MRLQPPPHAVTASIPCGYRRVHAIEKRAEFSRVNILMLWQHTADDLIAYGARTFYPRGEEAVTVCNGGCHRR